MAKEVLMMRDLGNGRIEGPTRVTRKAFHSIYQEKGFVLATRANTKDVLPDRASRASDRASRIAQHGGHAPEAIDVRIVNETGGRVLGGDPRDLDGDGDFRGVHDHEGNFDLGDDDEGDDLDDNVAGDDASSGILERGAGISAQDVARNLGLTGDGGADQAAAAKAAKAAKARRAGSERATGGNKANK